MAAVLASDLLYSNVDDDDQETQDDDEDGKLSKQTAYSSRVKLYEALQVQYTVEHKTDHGEEN